MTDSKFLASGLFAMSLFAVPGVDMPNVAIDGLALASGIDLKSGACNEVRVFVHAAPQWQGYARVQLVVREEAGDLTYSGRTRSRWHRAASRRSRLTAFRSARPAAI